MKYIRKIWIRILISFLLGAMSSEFFHIRYGQITPEASNIREDNQLKYNLICLLNFGLINFYFIKSITFSIGRPITAFFPFTTIGRSINFGYLTIASIH